MLPPKHEARLIELLFMLCPKAATQEYRKALTSTFTSSQMLANAQDQIGEINEIPLTQRTGTITSFSLLNMKDCGMIGIESFYCDSDSLLL